VLEKAAISTPAGSRVVRAIAILGDSVGVGIGDPAADGGWRGYGPLLAEALGQAELVNLASSGARIGNVRDRQLPQAVRARPDVTVLQAGINDTLRSDFDPARLHDDLDHIVATLTSAGAMVVLVRYHDHGRVFRIPGPLSRALAARIEVLNTILDALALRHQASIVDLSQLHGIYQAAAWSVDRLHPSELGHRMLARALAVRLAESGAVVNGEVSLECLGGAQATRVEHLAWLLFKGVPWLFQRGGDLVPYALATMLRDVRIRASRRDVGQRTS
jgi:lysophospholipase L1-like esterase